MRSAPIELIEKNILKDKDAIRKRQLERAAIEAELSERVSYTLYTQAHVHIEMDLRFFYQLTTELLIHV